MRYHEQLNIIFMRDNGPRRSIRLRHSTYYLLLIFFFSMPFLCILLCTQCWLLWQENVILRDNVDKFEADYQAAEAHAERLENLEELLREENVESREFILRKLAANGKTEVPASGEEYAAEPKPEDLPEGPGHEEFPVLDTGRVKVSNVQARVLRGNTLRLGLDLRNPDNEELLSGQVEATLVTQNGEKCQLVFAPQDIGTFRINRFKRAVMTAVVPKNLSPVNGELILEVKDGDGAPIYRNIFSIQR